MEVKKDDGKLHTAPYPWKSHRVENLLFHVRNILNRLLSSNLNSMVDELVALEIDTLETQRLVAVHIVDSAVDMPKLSDLIVQIIDRLELLLKYSKNNLRNGTNEQTDFIKEIIKAVEKMFQETTAHTEDGQINESEEELEIKRFRGIGLMIFIGQLFKYFLITVDFVTSCIDKLLDGFYEENLEFLYHLLQTVREKFEQTPKNDKVLCSFYCLEETITQLEDIITQKPLKPRVRCLLLKLIQLHKINCNHKMLSSDSEEVSIVIEYQEPKKESEQSNEIELHKSSNPWYPKTIKKDNPKDFEEIPLLLSKVRGLLNRLVPAKLKEIYDEIIKLRIRTKKRISVIARIFVTTALETPKYTDILVHLFYHIYYRLYSNEDIQEIFYNDFFETLTTEFFHSLSTDLALLQENKSLAESESQKQTIDDLMFDVRLRKCAIAILVGEVNKKIIVEACLGRILTAYSEGNFECFYYLILTVCKKFKKSPLALKNTKLFRSLGTFIENLQMILTNNENANNLRNKPTSRTLCLFRNIICYYRNAESGENPELVHPEIGIENELVEDSWKPENPGIRVWSPNTIHANLLFPNW